MAKSILYPNDVDGSQPLSNDTLISLRVPGIRDSYSAAPNLKFFQTELQLTASQARKLFSDIKTNYTNNETILKQKFRNSENYVYSILSWICRGLNLDNATRKCLLEAKHRAAWKQKQRKYWK